MSVHASFEELKGRVRARQGARVVGLGGLSLARTVWAISEQRPAVVIARSRTGADDLLRDLRFLGGEARSARILSLPIDERTPYHASSPDPLVVMERAATLYKLATGVPFDVLVLAPEAVTKRGMPLEALQRMGEVLAPDSDIVRDELIEKLKVGGYTRVNSVEDPGSFAVRGSIIDIFWPGLPRPFRIDLFGDTIDHIKLFDPQTQRADEKLEEVSFGPAREVHLDDETITRARQRLRDLADEVEFPTKKLRETLEDLDNRIPFFGIESLLPALHEQVELPLDLISRALGDDGFTVVIEDETAAKQAGHALLDDFVKMHHAALSRGDLAYPPTAFLEDVDDAWAALERRSPVVLGGLTVGAAGADAITIRAPATGELRQQILRESMRRDDEGDGGPAGLLGPLIQTIKQRKADKQAVLLPTASLGGTERLRELLRPHGLQVRNLDKPPDMLGADLYGSLADDSVHAWTYVARPNPPSRGADLLFDRVTVIAEDEIFGKRARRDRGQSGRKKGFKTTLADLNEGDHIVHVEHGIGVFQGLTRLNVRGAEQDFVLLTYAGEDKLYLPVHRINLIQKYAAAAGKPPRLDKLGGVGWQTTKKKVKKAVLAMAQQLLELYAKREIAKRPPDPALEESFLEFEAAFPFETTPDQQKAIDDVLGDMRGDRPMDRLICGDVGYGKTEVGMRAAMLAVSGGKQVAVLAPTTVLAQQHYLTFKDRFKETGAVIEVISRFRSSKEVKAILERLKEGKIDVLIGTHRLLSNDISFKNLGLVVVDEEQRFGVKAKEKLKRLRASVDMVTLTATPIPRTLQMGFFGIRDLSVIETAPVDRRAIRTSIIRFDDEVIREAMMRELGRSGQVYFVHNRVRSIQATADYIKRLVPEARVGIGHGQMEEKDLEQVMLQFINHEINVFVCTTIIETGIDVSTANTMFIDHADDFGLAQLYQLRGRVGRSKERAFAYLLIPSHVEHLTPDARKRLEVLQRFSDLGDGFKVAQHDLEIRGAGDMLGKGQSGHVTAVGYDLYAELLKEAVEELKGKVHSDVPDPDINLPVAAFVPDKYVVDLHERLSVYQRLATAKDGKEVYDIVGEVADRYGDPPAEVTALADVMILKQRLKDMAARALDLGKPVVEAEEGEPEPPPRVVITLGDKPKLDTAKIAALAAAEPDRIKITPQGKLVWLPDDNEWKACGREVLPLCRSVLRQVLEKAAAA